VEKSVNSPPVFLDPFVREQRGDLLVLRAAVGDDIGVDLLVTTRTGGVSGGEFSTLNLGNHVGDDPGHVAENRRRVAEAMSVDQENLIFLCQTHGVNVVNADAEIAPCEVKGDIVLLRSAQRAAAIMVADCVAIALIDPQQRSLALVHAGWRGLANSALATAHAALGASSSLVAVIAPAISPERYQAGPEVAAQFTHVTGALRSDHDNRSLLNLRLIVEHQLLALGVNPAQIFGSAEFTDDQESFFSDRAQRPCGRFALVAKWSS
jgi:YfiH family protein